jgi:hypothetical protein
VVDRLFELDESPDPKLVPVIRRRRPVQVVQGGLVIAAVVEDVAEVDAGFRMVVVELQRTTEGRDRSVVVA